MGILRLSLDPPRMLPEDLMNQAMPSILLFFCKLLKSECYL